jgi:hypothetical protein
VLEALPQPTLRYARTCRVWRAAATVVRLIDRDPLDCGGLRLTNPQHAVEVGETVVIASRSDTPLAAVPRGGGAPL